MRVRLEIRGDSETGGPQGGMEIQIANSLCMERGEVVAERRVEDAALAWGEDESHRLETLVHFRGGFGEHVDFCVTREASVEVNGGGEVRDILGDGVTGLEDAITATSLFDIRCGRIDSRQAGS